MHQCQLLKRVLYDNLNGVTFACVITNFIVNTPIREASFYTIILKKGCYAGKTSFL